MWVRLAPAVLTTGTVPPSTPWRGAQNIGELLVTVLYTRTFPNVFCLHLNDRLLFPPNSTEYGTVPALDYYLESLSDLRSDPSTTVYECTQGPGDLMFVPINWGHSTLNLESTIGMVSLAGS